MFACLSTVSSAVSHESFAARGSDGSSSPITITRADCASNRRPAQWMTAPFEDDRSERVAVAAHASWRAATLVRQSEPITR